MASCDNCRFVTSRQEFHAPLPPDAPPGTLPMLVRQGWCRRAPPTAFTPVQSSATPVSLGEWCGEHRWSIAGLFRALGALFRRK